MGLYAYIFFASLLRGSRSRDSPVVMSTPCSYILFPTYHSPVKGSKAP